MFLCVDPGRAFLYLWSRKQKYHIILQGPISINLNILFFSKLVTGIGTKTCLYSILKVSANTPPFHSDDRVVYMSWHFCCLTSAPFHFSLLRLRPVWVTSQQPLSYILEHTPLPTSLPFWFTCPFPFTVPSNSDLPSSTLILLTFFSSHTSLSNT